MSYNTQDNRQQRQRGRSRGRYSRGGRSSGARGRGAWSQERPYYTPREEFPAASGGPPSETKEVKEHQETKPQPQQPAKPSLAPKALSKTSSAEKNDPLISEAILIDGVSGFIERTRTREFYLDFTQYMQLIRSSYNAQITFDRGLKKYLSFGMYQYYSVVLLWRRVLYVISQRGERMLEYDRLVRTLNFDVPEPADLGLYLSGIGDITDFSDRHFQFSLQVYPNGQQHQGAAGAYGQVAANTAIMYETVPAPLVCLLKMQQDYLYTQEEVQDREWDLPEDLRPEDLRATLPTANLLGWSLADTLTPEQKESYADGMVNEDGFGVINIGNIPVNQSIIKTVAGLLENSKCKALSQPSATPTGSVAQVPYAVRSRNDADIQPLRSIGAKAAQTYCYAQASSHIASGSACFRYRVMRRLGLETRDSLCYRFRGGVIPDIWLVMENHIFTAGAVNIWNSDQYRISEQDGSGLATMVSNRVRRKVTKD